MVCAVLGVVRSAIVIVFVWLVAGCGPGSATPQQSVTTAAPTTIPVTTTTEAPTATTVGGGECPAGGGGQTSRGLYCPPDIPRYEGQSQVLSQMTPGTYRTRFFDTPLEFTNSNLFGILGEATFFVEIDGNQDGGAGRITVGNHATAAAFREADLASHECATNPVFDVSQVAGFPAETLTASWTCLIPVSVPGDPQGFLLVDGETSQLVLIGLSDRDVLIEVSARVELFDAYLTERAQQIIDTISFLDQ